MNSYAAFQVDFAPDNKLADFMIVTASKALHHFLGLAGIKTVLDVGSGSGEHANLMRESGLEVTTVNLEPPADIIEDFMSIPEEKTFDAVWAAHVLEHQLNPNLFLKKCFRMLDEEGMFCVTVPPLKHEIVGGHINLYNAGLLLYQMILAGFDCKEALVMQYSYNISVIVRKKEAIIPPLRMDTGDIEALADFFPFPAKHGFDGRKVGIKS